MVDFSAGQIAEVIESSSIEIAAQCCRLREPPPLGSLVRVVSAHGPLYAIVFQICTQSLDPSRVPTAYGKTEEELRREQPQIFELLRTQIRAFLVGYREGPQAIRQMLPPQPPRIHSFVYHCSPEEVREFAASLDFLRILFAAAHPPVDELIIAACRWVILAQGGGQEYAIRVGKELCQLLRSDYDRLKSIIRRALTV